MHKGDVLHNYDNDKAWERIGNTIYWGITVEKKCNELMMSILFGKSDDKTYELAKSMFHSFFQINPRFYE